MSAEASTRSSADGQLAATDSRPSSGTVTAASPWALLRLMAILVAIAQANANAVDEEAA